MFKQKVVTGMATLASVMVLSACSTNTNEESTSSSSMAESSSEMEQSSMASSSAMTSSDAATDSSMSHGEMEHDESGTLPTGIKKAVDPKYDIGDEVTIKADHMEGMDGAEATIVGAFDTTAYVVSYTPTDGSPRVENHKWVVNEEVEQPDNGDIKEGSEVTLMSNHMPGMEGATATIEKAEPTTVYMVDYMPTDGTDEVKNHKWVVEDEVDPK